jgi:hypothetical protein
MAYDPKNKLSPQAQYIRDEWGGTRIAEELYRVTNGRSNWLGDQVERNNNGRIPDAPARAYAAYLEEALRNHPDAPRLKTEADRVLSPAGAGSNVTRLTPAVDTGKTVHKHPPRIR